VPADIEVETLVTNGPRNTADVDWIGFENSDRHLVLGKEVGRGQSSRASADNYYLGFHVSPS
jgi:hypothetical protein